MNSNATARYVALPVPLLEDETESSFRVNASCSRWEIEAGRIDRPIWLQRWNNRIITDLTIDQAERLRDQLTLAINTAKELVPAAVEREAACDILPMDESIRLPQLSPVPRLP